MNYTSESCISRGLVAACVAVVLLFITMSNYHGLSDQDTIVALVLYAVAAYGLLPVHLANWLFGLACIAGLCALVICAPHIAIALAAVVGCIALIVK